MISNIFYKLFSRKTIKNFIILYFQVFYIYLILTIKNIKI